VPELLRVHLAEALVALDREAAAAVAVAEAAGDRVAAAIRARLADEVVALARAALERLGLMAADVDVVLGGGLFDLGGGFPSNALARSGVDATPRSDDSLGWRTCGDDDVRNEPGGAGCAERTSL
jgi:hypothetical protein